MDNINIKVSAKVNLTLDIIGKMPDGFHELDSVMCSVNVYDRIAVEKFDGNRVIMNEKPSNSQNIAYKTVELAIERCGICGAAVRIKKGIPFSAGMGGSSADASGVLYCLGKLYGIDDKTLNDLARDLGSDTNFMLCGGICRCSGKGDKFDRLKYRKIHFAIIKPQYGVNTAQVFADYDNRFAVLPRVKCTEKFIENYNSTDMSCFQYIHNDLQAPSIMINSGVEHAVKDMLKFTPYVSMTGSGSAVYGVFESENEARYAANALEKQYFFSRYAVSQDKGITE